MDGSLCRCTFDRAPDEVFQYLEPAHRLVHGTGLIAWEYAAGLRSWLLPGVLAAVLWLASLIGGQPAGERLGRSIVLGLGVQFKV
ncbi:MAG: hypothetical protein EXR05_01570 [Acetobacteraceae bacterium]|nr:hypothetical protein [Acetobacteraceae bacterium]